MVFSGIYVFICLSGLPQDISQAYVAISSKLTKYFTTSPGNSIILWSKVKVTRHRNIVGMSLGAVF